MVTTNTFISETTLFLETLLNTITDPISGKRSDGSKFVMTSYPQRKVMYPIITVKLDDTFVVDSFALGVSHQVTRMQYEIRVWARNVIEKDALTQSALNKLVSGQYPHTTAGKSLNENLFNAQIPTATSDVDELGSGGIKSRLIFVTYDFEIGE